MNFGDPDLGGGARRRGRAARGRRAAVGPARAGADGRPPRAASSRRIAGPGTRSRWRTARWRWSRRSACSASGPATRSSRARSRSWPPSTPSSSAERAPASPTSIPARYNVDPQSLADDVHRPHAGRHAGAPLRPGGGYGVGRQRSRHATAPRSSRTRRRRTAPRSTVAGSAATGSPRSRSTRPRTSRPVRAVWSRPTTTTSPTGLRMLRNHGMRARYEYESVGTNYRLTDVQAAIAFPQLARLDTTIEQRQANAARLDRRVGGYRRARDARGHAGIPARVPPVHGPRHRRRRARPGRSSPPSSHREECKAAYITHVLFSTTTATASTRTSSRAMFPHARATARQVLSLPVHPNLSDVRSRSDRRCRARRARCVAPRSGGAVKIAPVRIAIVGSGAMGALARARRLAVDGSRAGVRDRPRPRGGRGARRTLALAVVPRSRLVPRHRCPDRRVAHGLARGVGQARAVRRQARAGREADRRGSRPGRRARSTSLARRVCRSAAGCWSASTRRCSPRSRSSTSRRTS